MSKPSLAARGDDLITLGSALTGGQYDLGSGADSMILANTATNTITLVNVETLTGGTGSDQVTLSAAITGGSFDLGFGHRQADAVQRGNQYADRCQYRDP